MSKKKSNLSSILYKANRKIGKIASKLNDIETLSTGNPEKIVKRYARKKTYKQTNKVTRKINNKFFK